MSGIKIEFNKVTPFRVEINIVVDEKTIIKETIEMNPEFFDEEAADMYARMMAMLMQMSAGIFQNLFKPRGDESNND